MAEAQAAQRAFQVSWDQLHRDARALAWRLTSVGHFEAIVCVTRGGLVPAGIVARELEIRLIDTNHLSLTFLFQSGSIESREQIDLKRTGTRPS